MRKKQKKVSTIKYFAKNLFVVFGLVLIWRGIWHILDKIDIHFFQGEHFYTGIAGIIIGLAILYIPDRDLKEIEKL